MKNNLKCPECGSSDLFFDESKLAYICRECNPEFEKEDKFKPLRIFLSYGHDKHSKDACRIKKDLEKRGHKVWFDLEKIIEGRDWDRYIEDGLKWCDKVVLLMTPYSVRRRDFNDPESTDGFCLNEIAKALEKNKLIIPVLLVEVEDGAPTSICRIQYLDMRDAVPIIENEEKYSTGLDRLAMAIEHNDLDFEGGQVRLEKLLKPLKFEEEIGEHISRFQGRDWFINELNQWLDEENDSRVFWLEGGPGIGKTAISSYLCHNHGKLIAHHLCIYKHEDKANPQRAILSIAYYIAQHIPEYQKKIQNLELENEVLKNTQTIFDNIIIQPLSDIKNPEKTFFVLIDALDEASKDERNEIAEFIRDQWSRTPSWLKLMITSRPEPDLKTTLSDLKPHILNAKSEENLKDLREFLDYELKKRDIDVDENDTEILLSKSEGLFLYLEKVLEEIDAKRLFLDNLDEFPQGLSGIYQKFFKRQFSDIDVYRSEIKPIIECICAQKQPLPLNILFDAIDVDDAEGRIRLGYLSSLFPINKKGTKKRLNETIKPFHKSVIDWLVDVDENTGLFKAGSYAIDLKEGNKKLSYEGWREYQKGTRQMSGYMISNLPDHLIPAEDWDHLTDLLTDLKYIERKCEAGMTYKLFEDYNKTLNVLPAAQEEKIEKIKHEKRLKKYSEDLIAYSNGEIHAIRIPPSIKPWSKERIRKDNERITNNPTRLDILKSYSQFVNAEGHALIEFGSLPSFCIQQAFNSANAGPVADSAAKIISEENRNSIILKNKKWLSQYNPHSAKIKTLLGHGDSVLSVDITPDGKTAITGSNDNTAKIWDLQTGKTIKTLQNHQGPINSVAITPNAKTAITGSNDNTAKIWDLQTGKTIKTLQNHQGPINSVAITPNAKTAITGSNDNTAKIWDLQTGKTIKTLKDHQRSIYSVNITPDAKIAITGSSDNTAKIWDLQTGKTIKTLKDHQRSIYSVNITPDAKIAITGSSDNTAKIWDLQTGKTIKTLKDHQRSIYSVNITPDAKMAITGSYKEVCLWDVGTGELLKKLFGHVNNVVGVALSADGSIAITVSEDRTICLWDVETGDSLKPKERHQGAVYDLVVENNGKTAITGSSDNTAKIWDLQTGKTIKTLEGHRGSINSIIITPNAKTAITGSNDNTAKIWDLQTGKTIKTLEGHRGSVYSVAITPNAKTGITGNSDTSLQFWDLSNGKELQILKGHDNWVGSLAVTPDGKYLLAGSYRVIYLWDLKAGKQLKKLNDHKGFVYDIVITEDGKTAITCSGDRTIKLWDLKTGKMLNTLEGHTDRVVSLALTPDGKKIISGSWDRTIRVWDLETAEMICVSKEESDVLALNTTQNDYFVFGNITGDVIVSKLI
ncbi:MAG: WD domain, G-beta repeat [Methanobacterium sp. PtaB.Bin024]|nr:MAG: WD domain, G-beta repeat [Methanobacterium sp. PtaB.Bin024]